MRSNERRLGPEIHVVSKKETPEALRLFLGAGRRSAPRYMALRRFLEVDREMQPVRGARVLDIGTGGGYHVMMLAQMGAEPVGLDIDGGPLGTGMRLADHSGIDCRLVRADGERLPFGEGVFRYVSMVETIEHVYETCRLRVLAECYRVLVPGGRIVLSTPNFGGLIERARRLLSRRLRTPYAATDVSRSAYRPDAYHLPWPLGRIVDGLEEAGFSVLPPSYFLFVIKTTPKGILPLAIQLESALESIPGLSRLAATVRLVGEKPTEGRGTTA